MIKITTQEFVKLAKEDIKGKIICFPTDTVYGVGAMLDDEVGIRRIYQLKHREETKPLALLASSISQILPYVEITPQIEAIMKEYWPGALTIIFRAKGNYSFNQGLSTIGFRIPNSPIALAILSHFGIMATTSVNLSGEDPLNSLSEIETHFGSEIDYGLTDEALLSKVSSTVIDATGSAIKILRQGNIKINV